MSFVRVLILMAGFALLAGCETNDLKKPPVPLGDFVLGVNVGLADTPDVPSISRKATPDEWKAGIEKAMADRFGRYDGNRIYNFAVRVDGYVLAPPVLPVVAAIRSALIVTVFVFDDATQTLLNPGGKQLTMVEAISPQSFIGSGITQTKAQQIALMSYRAALSVQNYLLENPGWLNLPPVGAPAAGHAAKPEVAPVAAAVGAAAAK